MTRCDECGWDWDATPAHAVATITVFPDRLATELRAADLHVTEERARTRPRPDVWSPLEYVAHVRDALDWYGGRISRILTEDQPSLEGFDFDAYTARQQYNNQPAHEVLVDASRACNEFNCFDIQTSADDMKRTGRGSDGTMRTVTQLLRRAAHETHHHLHDIRAELRS